VVVIAAMNNNVVYPADNPPSYSQVPPSPSRPSPSAPYGQSTLLHNDGKQSQPGPAPQSAWNDPNQRQTAGYPQYPPPQPGCDPYGQPMAAPYPPPPAYGAPYCAPPSQYPPQHPQQQQQQQVVMVNGQQQPIIRQQPETFIGQMILACFVLWCCNCLFGLVAFILAGQLNSLFFSLAF